MQRKMVAAFNNWRAKYYKKQGEKWDAAIKIQTRIRIFHAKIELQRLKDLRDFLIKMIQARIRAKIARTRVKIVKWKKKIMYRQAATKIQALYRGYSCRGYIWGHMTHAVISIQSLWRNYRWRKERREAAATIQRYYKAYVYDQLLLKHWCAMKIAAIYRGHLARRWVRMNRASTNIAKVYRGYVARTRIKALRKRLQKFWANILFEEFDSRNKRTIKEEKMSPLRKKIILQQGRTVPPSTSRVIYDGNQLADRIWNQFPAENLASLQQIKPVPMPTLEQNAKASITWKREFSKPVYGDNDPARMPSKLPNIQKSPPRLPSTPPDPLSETSLLGGVIYANYLVPKTPGHGKRKHAKPDHVLKLKAKKKTLRQKKRLLPLASDRDGAYSYTTKTIMRSGDVNLLKSFANLRSKGSPTSLKPIRHKKRRSTRR